MVGKLLLDGRIPLLKIGGAAGIVVWHRSNLGNDVLRNRCWKGSGSCVKCGNLSCAVWITKSRSHGIEVRVDQVVEDPISAPDRRPAVTKDIPIKPKSRIDVPRGGVPSEHIRGMREARRNSRLRRTAVMIV